MTALALGLLVAQPCAAGGLAEPTASAGAGAQRVFVRDGHVGYAAADRVERRIGGGGQDAKPVLSPDGTLIAFIREAPSKVPRDDRSADVMAFDVAGGVARTLITATAFDPSEDPVETLTWSLDGGHLYALVGAYATTGEIVQIRVADGRRRTVIDGNSLAVIRSGPLRGHLLVRRHKYLRGPEGGSYDPVDVVRPDGRVMTTVPGSGRDDQQDHVGPWLRAHGWTAS